MIELFNEDCMVGMARYPDKYFELAIVDPPYFEGPGDGGYFNTYSKGSRPWKSKTYPQIAEWKIPDVKFFVEIERVSKEYIIWGINYFPFLSRTSGRIVWDKQNDNSSFSNCEIATNTLIKKVVIYRFMWNGFLQADMNNKENRIHPTQKPVKLYEWLLKNYAKKGDKILDTHLGSGSIAIACYNLGFDLTGFEIDEDYYKAAVKRLEDHKKQGRIFDNVYPDDSTEETESLKFGE